MRIMFAVILLRQYSSYFKKKKIKVRVAFFSNFFIRKTANMINLFREKFYTFQRIYCIFLLNDSDCYAKFKQMSSDGGENRRSMTEI